MHTRLFGCFGALTLLLTADISYVERNLLSNGAMQYSRV